MRYRSAALPALAVATALAALPAWSVEEAVCPAPGQWLAPGGGTLEVAALYDTLAEAPAVLLGERHDLMDHHRWQLHVLAGLHARRPDLVIGLEMLPDSAQPALDAWVAGELDRDGFVRASDWHRAWGHDIELYLPVLHFARLHRVPLVALNLERELASRLAEEGWDAVPEDERRAIPPPAEPPQAYRERLERVFEAHPAATMDGRDAERFLRAQLVWDRAMAAAIAGAVEAGRPVVALIGRGHLEYGHGVPHQLADLGVRGSRVLLPLDLAADGGCEPPAAGVADAVFALEAQPPPRQPQLGVLLDEDAEGLRVREVRPRSPASRAGLAAGDRFITAAGRPVEETVDLVSIVRRQAPGTWLPLEVQRDGESLDLVVVFAPDAD